MRKYSQKIESYTVKSVCNDRPGDPKFIAPLLTGSCSEVGICYKDLNWDYKIIVAVGCWSLFKVGR
jgi:hypothetical protein